MLNIKKYIANIITTCRIICSILMLLFPVQSVQFYILYLICGFSDIIDGFVARKTNSTSNFGTIFDTFADFIFVLVTLIKLLPLFHLANWLYMWIGIIALIKCINVITGFIYKKKLVSVHTMMNKITGLSLFLLPLLQTFIDIEYCAIAICSIATFSAVQEGYYIKSGREIN